MSSGWPLPDPQMLLTGVAAGVHRASSGPCARRSGAQVDAADVAAGCRGTVPLASRPDPGGDAAGDRRRPELVSGIVDAIQRLETRGHFGPFAVVLGHNLFRIATSPSRSLVLPTDRLAEFLDGRRVQRSGVLPPNRGVVVVASGGQPIELVLASDIDVRFLQATLEPRYVLRVFERLVLRIKELDAVCVRHDR